MSDAFFFAGCAWFGAGAVLGAADLLYRARRRRFDGRAEAGGSGVPFPKAAVHTRSDPGPASAGLSRPGAKGGGELQPSAYGVGRGGHQRAVAPPVLLSHEDDGMRMVLLVTVGAAVLGLVLGGGYYLAAWITEEPRRIGGVLMFAAGVGLMVAGMRRMPE